MFVQKLGYAEDIGITARLWQAEVDKTKCLGEAAK